MMAFDKWALLYSALLLLVSSIGNIHAQSCGDNYTTDYGVFASPNYPNVYDLNSECTYRILLPTDSQITLSFETFELDRSPGDYVLITCESNTDYVRSNYSWNVNIAPIWLSSCSIGRLDFISDSYRNFSTRGFKVQYQVSTRACDKTVFTSSSGTISSPNYPQSYNNNENCTYSIWAPEYSSFTLTFQAFDMESDCERDWFQIRCDNSSYISTKYCGSTLPKPANISNCIRVLIWFHTDSSNVFSGFSLQYSFTADGCGKIDYAGLSGIITSANYPKGNNRMFCEYYLHPVCSVALAFQTFDLEPFADMSYGDYVQVACVSNMSDGYRNYRGNSLPSLISYTQCRLVRLVVSSNYVLCGTGFNLKYQVNPLVANSAITNAPKNFTVDVGSRMQLDCTSNATDYYPSWTLSREGTDENTTVIASFCVVSNRFTLQYRVVTDGPGVCNLVAESATLWHAGVYTCIDASLASAISVVTLIDPTISSGQDVNVAVIVLSVFLAIFALGYIAIAIFLIVRRHRGMSKEEDERNPNQHM